MMKFIVWILSCLMSTFGFIYFYSKITDSNLKYNKKLIITFVICVFLISLVKYYNIKFLSVVSYFWVCPILFYLINHQDIKSMMFYIFTIWIYAILLDFSSMLVIAILYYVFNSNVNSMLFTIVPSIYVFGMLIITANSKKLKSVIQRLHNLVLKIKYADFMLAAFTGFVFISGIILALNIKHINIGLMSFALVILSVLIFSLLLKFKYNEIENTIFLSRLYENNQFYIKVDQEQRILKHNLVAKLSGVKSVSNSRSKVLIDDLIKDFNSNIDFSKNMKNIPYGFNGIISQKIYPFNDTLNIKVVNSIKDDIFNLLKPKRYNVLVEKLNVLLDNALESCSKSAKKILFINLYKENNNIVIEIKNTFSGKLDLDSLGNINYSTKGDKRGLGLYSVFRNNEATLNVSIINNMFVAKLLAKINKY